MHHDDAGSRVSSPLPTATARGASIVSCPVASLAVPSSLNIISRRGSASDLDARTMPATYGDPGRRVVVGEHGLVPGRPATVSPSRGAERRSGPSADRGGEGSVFPALVRPRPRTRRAADSGARCGFHVRGPVNGSISLSTSTIDVDMALREQLSSCRADFGPSTDRFGHHCLSHDGAARKRQAI